MSNQSTNIPDQLQGILQELDEVHARVQFLERALVRNQRLSTLGTLAAGVAHELNNILTPPANYARLALRDPDDRELNQKALERVIHSCDRAGRVVETILGFARGGDENSACLVAEAVEVAIDCAHSHPEISCITMEKDIDPLLRIAMSASQLEQVLLNLLINAIKAIGSNRGTIRIWAKCSTWNTLAQDTQCSTWNTRASDERVAEIRVEDSGPGVAAEIRESLFEAFVTSPRAESGAGAGQGADQGVGTGQGTGLGLAICEQLVREAGGSISLGDTDLGGACFSIVLPAAA